MNISHFWIFLIAYIYAAYISYYTYIAFNWFAIVNYREEQEIERKMYSELYQRHAAYLSECVGREFVMVGGVV